MRPVSMCAVDEFYGLSRSIPLDSDGLRTRTSGLVARSCGVGVFANGMIGFTTYV